jgi:cobalt-zinc-cadmium resistance protein CzcA
MIARILSLSVQARWFIVFLAAVIVAYGSYQVTLLPIDALPDITNKQVMINFSAPELGPEEIERRITFPIEIAISGLAGVESTRSFSRNGYGQVTAIFDESQDLYFMRQRVAERLAQAKPSLPPGVEPLLGPVSTGLGEIFMYSVDYANPGGQGATIRDGEPGWQSGGSFLTPEGERLTDEVARLAYLRTVQDWIIRPLLKTVPGVADVDSLAGMKAIRRRTGPHRSPHTVCPTPMLRERSKPPTRPWGRITSSEEANPIWCTPTPASVPWMRSVKRSSRRATAFR